MRKLIFCTSHVDLDPERYTVWADYYKKFFIGANVDLLMVNDGPILSDSTEVETIELSPHLGRLGIWCFPGWKRSFSEAIRAAKNRGYERIGHIESDCWIKPDGKKEFLQFLEAPGYFTGYCKTYDFPETALQILNTPEVINYYLNKYNNEKSYFEEINFENIIKRDLSPTYILNGDRYENNPSRDLPEYTYLAQFDLRCNICRDFVPIKRGNS